MHGRMADASEHDEHTKSKLALIEAPSAINAARHSSSSCFIGQP
jgi:hypothetical protein